MVSGRGSFSTPQQERRAGRVPERGMLLPLSAGVLLGNTCDIDEGNRAQRMRWSPVLSESVC